MSNHWLNPIDAESGRKIAEAIEANGLAVRTLSREALKRLDAAETALSIAETREWIAQMADYGEREFYSVYGIGSRK